MLLAVDHFSNSMKQPPNYSQCGVHTTSTLKKTFLWKKT